MSNDAGNDRRVDTAAQEDSNWDVGCETDTYGLDETFANASNELILRPAVDDVL